MSKPKIVFLTGAGMSQESGLQTFRGAEDSLWNNVSIEDVCTDTAWLEDPNKVNAFYNQYRKHVQSVEPNRGHLAIAEINPDTFDVHVITTNVDDLHERAGSQNILHIHGNILKARCDDPDYNQLSDEDLGDLVISVAGRDIQKDERYLGFKLRPHIVFFGESVPHLPEATALVQEADYLVIVGTSLSVYPAAGLINYTKDTCKTFYVDPEADPHSLAFFGRAIPFKATSGVPQVIHTIIQAEEKKQQTS